MSQTIAYWEAWAAWFSANEVPVDATLGPWTILTLGRIGKIASFAGGATIILDLIGPDRLRNSGRKVKPAWGELLGDEANGNRHLVLAYIV